MKSYSDSAYDVTNYWLFEKFLAYTLFLPSFIVVGPQITELNWGVAPVHYRVSQTLSKIGSKYSSYGDEPFRPPSPVFKSCKKPGPNRVEATDALGLSSLLIYI